MNDFYLNSTSRGLDGHLVIFFVSEKALGDSLEILLCDGLASMVPTIEYVSGSPFGISMNVTVLPRVMVGVVCFSEMNVAWEIMFSSVLICSSSAVRSFIISLKVTSPEKSQNLRASLISSANCVRLTSFR